MISKMLTAIEIQQYRTSWMIKGGYPIKISDFAEDKARDWCSSNLKPEQWFVTRYSQSDQHTVWFELQEHADRFSNFLRQKTVTISAQEYIQLRVDSERLARLEIAGVDNWDWYSEALYGRKSDETTLDEFEENLKKEYLE